MATKMTKEFRVEVRVTEHSYIPLLQPPYFSSVLSNILFHHPRWFKNPFICPTPSLTWIVDSVYSMNYPGKKIKL